MNAKRKKVPADRLKALVEAQCNDARKRRQLYIELNSISPFIPNYVAGVVNEKDRRRSLAKVKTNALRLAEALLAIDGESFEFAGCHMVGSDSTNRSAQLHALAPMNRLVEACKKLSTLDAATLPAQNLKVRPEMLIASGVVGALRKADIDPGASDTGFAADCFREVCSRAKVSATESPRYWLGKAKKTPEI